MPKNPNLRKPIQTKPRRVSSDRRSAKTAFSEAAESSSDQEAPPKRPWRLRKTREKTSAAKPIGERMVRAGLIERKQLAEALTIQQQTGRRTVDTLFALGYLRPVAFTEFAAKEVRIAAIDLKNYMISSETKTLLDRSFAEQREVLPLGRVGRVLTLAMACPFDRETVLEVEKQTGLRVCPVLCEARDIWHAIKRLYGPPDTASDTS